MVALVLGFVAMAKWPRVLLYVWVLSEQDLPLQSDVSK